MLPNLISILEGLIVEEKLAPEACPLTVTHVLHTCLHM